MDFYSNIKKYYFYTVFRSLFFIIAINILYYLSFGLTYTQIMTLAITFALITLILEVPSGAFADLYGRKLSLVLSSVSIFIGYAFFAFGNSFLPFMIANAFMGISMSLFSGTNSAFLYDSLLASKRTDEYKKVESTVTSIKLASFAIASVIGAFLFSYHIKLPYYSMFVVAFIGFLIALTFKEPERHKEIRTHWQQLVESSKFAFKNREVKFLLIYTAAITGFSHISHRFIQPYLVWVGFDVKMIGIIFFFTLLFSAIVIKKAHVIEEWLGERNIIVVIPLFVVISFVGMGAVKAVHGIVFLFLFQIASEIIYPVTKDYINRHVSSDMRATVLSLGGFGFNTTIVIFALFFGRIADTISLSKTFFSFGIILFVIAGITVFLWFRKK